jgi:hypothetical protein
VNLVVQNPQHRVGSNILLARERRFRHGGMWDAPPERLLRLGRRAAGAPPAPQTEEEAQQVRAAAQFGGSVQNRCQWSALSMP